MEPKEMPRRRVRLEDIMRPAVSVTPKTPARAAFSQIVEGGDMGLFPYEVEALVERGEIVPRSLVVGYELGEPLPDLSE